MATQLPPFDDGNPYLRGVYDDYRKRTFPNDKGLEQFRVRFKQHLRKGYRKPYVRDLLADVIDGRWKIGNSQTEIAHWLGLEDPSSVSNAARWGAISTEMLVPLLTCPMRPADWDPTRNKGLLLEMETNAFTYAVAFSRYACNLEEDDSKFSELDYELLYNLFCQFEEWNEAVGHESGRIIASKIATKTITGNAERLLRPWYTKEERVSLSRILNALIEDSAFALKYLRSLQEAWESPFIFAWGELEQVNW